MSVSLSLCFSAYVFLCVSVGTLFAITSRHVNAEKSEFLTSHHKGSSSSCKVFFGNIILRKGYTATCFNQFYKKW